MFNFQHGPMSALMEYFIHHIKTVDQQMFATLPFEDDVGIGRVKAVDIWRQDISERVMRVMPKELSEETFGDVIPGVSIDGTYMKIAKGLNNRFPRNSKRRKLLAKICKLFIR